MREALARHWPEYLIEAAGLGFFMTSACLFGAVLEHPASPVRLALPDPVLRRGLMGIAMGLTAIAIIYSPWGRQSGAHINPSTTLAFLRLGKVEPWDAGFYVLAQFAGATAAVLLLSVPLAAPLKNPAVNYVATVPGSGGAGPAFLAEVGISFLLMTAVLTLSNSARWNRLTGLVAGALVAAYILVEAPISGMSMNPARTFGSAVAARTWTAMWVYFTAPVLGMLLAAEIYVRLPGARQVLCAKLDHDDHSRCIFRCGYHACSERNMA